MKLTIVGTSCTWFRRNNTSYIIDDNILIDTPEGSYKDIISYVDILNIDAVFISHFHTDHFTDLHIIATNYMRYSKKKEKLKVYAPKGALEKLITFNKLFFGGDDETNVDTLTQRVEFIEIKDGMSINVGKYTFNVHEMNHGRVQCFGFTVSDDATTVGFSIDTKPCENLYHILSVSKYAFVDLSAMKPHNSHICIEEFEELLKNYPQTKIFPIHTCDETQEYAIKHGFNYVNDGDIFNF